MTPQKWQHKTLYLKTSTIITPEKRSQQLEDTLNKAGAQGWELVTVQTDGSGRFFAFLKKPL